MLKSELRNVYKEKRKTLSRDEVLSLSDRIFSNFISFFKPKWGDKIHLFLSIKKFNEVDTSRFIQYCWENGIKVYVPKMNGDVLISIELTKETQLIEHSWGILEPKSNEDSEIVDFDYVITPLLYADSKGNRVGYGKGFYDQLFSTLPDTCLKAGVNFFPPKEDVDNVWENDVPLDYLVLPTEVVSFTGCV